MKKVLALSSALVLVLACKKDMEEKAKETINKSGKAVERTANRVVDEISAHINRDLGCKLEVSDDLKAKGLTTGKFYIEKDSVTGNNNKLVIYIINEQKHRCVLTFKVTDKEDVEIGRTTIYVTEKTNLSGYMDVIFDKRTDIESKSTISIY